jgi:glucuronate isomerase
MKFIDEKFLLHNRAAQRLYRQFAEHEPIFDYHCHLSPKDIAENRQFRNLFEIWLEGDHYKWRAMRANGVAEKFCTGAAEPFDKFRAWAATVPHTLRNPLYHWTHLELKRYFGIDELLDEESAARVWKKANEQLARPEFTARGILKKFNVTTLCTTDDPVDDLAHHKKIAADGVATRVFPLSVPDKALAVNQPAAFNAWVGRLEQAAGMDIANLEDFVAALRQRHDYFHAQRLPAVRPRTEPMPGQPVPGQDGGGDFCRARRGQAASPEEHAQFGTWLMLHLGDGTRSAAGSSNCTSARCATTTPDSWSSSAPTRALIASEIFRKPRPWRVTSICWSGRAPAQDDRL